MKQLAISPSLSVPIDAVTQRLGFLGKPGSGKSYAATKLAELMLDAGAQVVAVDPVGVWYGLRLDGVGRGIALPVLGGLHGDIPLEQTAGPLVADLVVDRKLSCVLDLSQFEHDTEKARFAEGFMSRFFFRMKSSPSAVHLFFEECQELFPQNPARGEERMLHAGTRLAKLGRNFGIGYSLISQRPQEVNKKVLNLTECLFAFQMTGAHERKAIRDWVTTVGADENMLTVLPSLAIGHAHIYSPQWLHTSKTILIGQKRTADVSSTPSVGASVVEGKPLTPVDLGKLRMAMAATIEKAKAEDPRELRKQILDRDRKIAALERDGEAVPSRDIIEAAEHRGYTQANDQLRDRVDAVLHAAIERVRVIRTDAIDGLDALSAMLAARGDTTATMATIPSGSPVTGPPESAWRRNPSVKSAPMARAQSFPAAEPDGALAPGARKLLIACAKFAAIGLHTPTRTQVAALAPMSPSSSATSRYFAALSTGGYLDMPSAGVVCLTDAGRRTVPRSAPPRLEDYLREWQRLLGHGAEGKLYETATNHMKPGDVLSRAKLAELAGVSFTSSATARAFAWLIGLDLLALAGTGNVQSGSTMYPEGLK